MFLVVYDLVQGRQNSILCVKTLHALQYLFAEIVSTP